MSNILKILLITILLVKLNVLKGKKPRHSGCGKRSSFWNHICNSKSCGDDLESAYEEFDDGDKHVIRTNLIPSHEYDRNSAENPIDACQKNATPNSIKPCKIKLIKIYKNGIHRDFKNWSLNIQPKIHSFIEFIS